MTYPDPDAAWRRDFTPAQPDADPSATPPPVIGPPVDPFAAPASGDSFGYADGAPATGDTYGPAYGATTTGTYGVPATGGTYGGAPYSGTPYSAAPYSGGPYPQPYGASPSQVVVNPAPFGADPVTGEPYSDKSKVAAGLLGIFLGSLGIGRFYAGNTGLGVAQLLVSILTCGIGGIWGFIDGIVMLAGRPRDGQGRLLHP